MNPLRIVDSRIVDPKGFFGRPFYWNIIDVTRRSNRLPLRADKLSPPVALYSIPQGDRWAVLA